MEHFEFIAKTDRRNMYTQLKMFVDIAKQTSEDELEQRRNSLRELLKADNRFYKAEFSKKVKSRIDEDILKRRDSLLRISEENVKKERDFLEIKRIQQYINSCYEIREQLRRKDQLDTKECLINQILENECKVRRERELDKYWAKVQRKNVEREDKRQANEDCLKKKYKEQTKFVLDVQLEDHASRREEELKERAVEVARINNLVEEIRLEEFNKKITHGVSPKTLAYRKDLLDEIARKEAQRKAEERERADLHRQMIAELQRLEAEECAAAALRRREAHIATREYLAYVRRMRHLDRSQQKMRDDNIDDMSRVDTCTKNNIAREIARKAEIAERCYSEVRRQICEQLERRLREETERRECKIIENRFAPPGISRDEVLKQRRKNREGLDAQIAALKIIRAEEEKRYNESLMRAANDPVFCGELAEKYMRERIDYLEPHANWRMVACPTKEFVAKPPGDPTDFKEPGSGQCIAPCGCEARANRVCALRNVARLV